MARPTFCKCSRDLCCNFFTARSHNNKYCGKRCRDMRHGGSAHIPKECLRCRVVFFSPRAKNFCSHRCAALLREKTNPEPRRAYMAAYRAFFPDRAREKAQRSRIKNGAKQNNKARQNRNVAHAAVALGLGTYPKQRQSGYSRKIKALVHAYNTLKAILEGEAG